MKIFAFRKKKSAENARHDMLVKAYGVCLNAKVASNCLLQRKLCIGYRMASEILDELETMGLVSEKKENYKRDVKINEDGLRRLLRG